MKFLFAVLLAFVACVSAQVDQAITEDLLNSQEDLALGHEFFETALFINRGQISAYLYRINRELIDSHLDAYSDMMTQVTATNEELDSITVTEDNRACMDFVRTRWENQVLRFGHRLGDCIDIANRMMNGWNRFLLNIHETSQITANQVQNLGSKVLAETDIHETRESYPQNINREFRDLLKLALPYHAQFNTFLENISTNVTDVIQILSDCDRAIEEDLAAEIEEDLLRANNC